MDFKTIHIVGDGGIGSNISLPLLKFLKYHRQKNGIDSSLIINIIDGDDVEMSNLDRQHFIPEDVGRKKAEITGEYLSDVCIGLKASNIAITHNTSYLKEDNISNIIGEDSVVFIAVDNFITRTLIEDHMETLSNILCINGGNDYDDGEVQVMLRKDGEWQTKKMTELHPEMRTNPDKYPDELSCEEASVSAPQLLLANMFCAQYMLEALYSFISSDKIEWIEKFFDLRTGAVRVVRP